MNSCRGTAKSVENGQTRSKTPRNTDELSGKLNRWWFQGNRDGAKGAVTISAVGSTTLMDAAASSAISALGLRRFLQGTFEVGLQGRAARRAENVRECVRQPFQGDFRSLLLRWRIGGLRADRLKQDPSRRSRRGWVGNCGGQDFISIWRRMRQVTSVQPIPPPRRRLRPRPATA